ncbi:MAG: hypothetical protein SGI86_15560 [Deltaproteobacteria bacterium]|nr:hypothetical protein [Deltaproteobacteria bacterium]
MITLYCPVVIVLRFAAPAGVNPTRIWTGESHSQRAVLKKRSASKVLRTEISSFPFGSAHNAMRKSVAVSDVCGVVGVGVVV